MDLWGNLTSADIWQTWSTLNPLEGLYGEAGYLDNTPLYNYLLNLFKGKEVKKRLIVSANDANSGAYISMHLYNSTMSNEQKVASIVGSASVPFAFPPYNMSRFGLPYLLMDGGTTWNNNMISGINECHKLGFKDDSQIILDIIVLNSDHLDVDPITNNTTPDLTMKMTLGWPQTISNYFRERTIKGYY